MTSFEALYGHKCGAPLWWFQDGENFLVGLELLKQTSERINKRGKIKWRHLWVGRSHMQIKKEAVETRYW